MKKQNIIFASIALVFGLFVFLISLFIASQNNLHLASGVSEKTFYTGTILPDHIFYPVLMVFDRGLLLFATEEKEVAARIYLAQDRMERAQLLLLKDQEELALTTLTKSQKYLFLAVTTFNKLENPSSELHKELLTALLNNTQKMSDSKSKFKRVNAAPIEDLLKESEILISALLADVEK